MTSSKAGWMDWIDWESPPRLVRTVNADRNLLPSYPGIYLFSVGAGPLTPATAVFQSGDDSKMEDGDVLYVGITQNKKGIKGRFEGEYLRKDPTKQTDKLRRAAAMLQGWMIDPNVTNRLFVRWALLEAQRSLLRDLETALIQFYGAPLNVMQQNSFTPYDDVCLSGLIYHGTCGYVGGRQGMTQSCPLPHPVILGVSLGLVFSGNIV